MISAKDFVDYLKLKKLSFYSGVPDSLLKELISYISINLEEDKKNRNFFRGMKMFFN